MPMLQVMDYESSGRHVLLGEVQSSAQKLQDAIGELAQPLVQAV
jgi:hypothetical protein